MLVYIYTPISNPGLSRSIFELLFELLHACVGDLASLACYALMCNPCLPGCNLKPFYAILFCLSTHDLVRLC
jgi:hypothetical protein